MNEVCTTPEGKALIFDAEDHRDVENVLRKYCGDDLSSSITRELDELLEMADFNKAKINSDLTAYESELEEYHDMLMEMAEIARRFLDDYRLRKVHNRRITINDAANVVKKLLDKTEEVL